MITKVLLSLVAGTNWAAAAPTQEMFYQILAPDQTTVLCDSTTPGSCDPLLPRSEVFFSGGSELTVFGPSVHRFDTSLTIWLNGEVTDNYIRLRHFFEDEIDLGWYAFAGGTGDFLAEYNAGYADTGFSPFLPHLSIESPFPNDFSNQPIYRRETFGRPFRVKMGYRVIFDYVLSMGELQAFPGGTIAYHDNRAVYGRGCPIDKPFCHPEFEGFDVQLVPVPELGEFVTGRPLRNAGCWSVA